MFKKTPNLPSFKERFRPPVTELVEQDRSKPFNVEQYFAQQFELLSDMIDNVRANVRPEFDPSFIMKEQLVSPNGQQITYETRMFQYVIVNFSSVSVNVGFSEAANTNTPYRYVVPTNRLFVSPVSFFSQLTVAYASAPAVGMLAFVYAYNRIIHTPGMYSLT